jgi:hypothetical protein
MQRTASEMLINGNPVMYIKEQQAGIWETFKQMCSITACCGITYPFSSLSILKFHKYWAFEVFAGHMPPHADAVDLWMKLLAMIWNEVTQTNWPAFSNRAQLIATDINQ